MSHVPLEDFSTLSTLTGDDMTFSPFPHLIYFPRIVECGSWGTSSSSLGRILRRSFSFALGRGKKTIILKFSPLHIILQPPPSFKGQFGPKGALYSGWETRRHNHGNDWCVPSVCPVALINKLCMQVHNQARCPWYYSWF